ncbi:MAG TPA: hypothetical protein VFU23_04940 [Gemmatimonadales bacterium]|nr:hypothetical protein [Gemmatimonadales bacterium]
MPAEARSSTSAARVVYAGIVASTLISTGGALATSLTLGTASTMVDLSDWLGLAAGLGAIGAGFRQRRVLTGAAAPGPLETWWSEHAGRVLLMWGLLELGGLFGAVLLFATGHLPAYAVLTALALVGIVLTPPGRIAQNRPS